MANKGTTLLLSGIIEKIVENTNGLISADVLKTELINLIQSRGLFEVFVSTKVYLQNEHISFENQIYKCLSDTIAAESPTTTPAKWQVIGSVSAITADLVGYTEFTYTNVKQALDNHENLITALVPDAPVGLAGRALTMVTYQALEAGTGTSHECTDDTTPEATIDDLYNASAGDLSCEIDAVQNGLTTLDENDNSGTYTSLVIVEEKDPNEGQLGQGIYKVLDAAIRPQNSIAVSVHTYQLIHSVTGASALLTFYIDNPVVTTISNTNITLPVAASKYVSGVPSLQAGDELDVQVTIQNSVGKHYNATRIAMLNSSETDTVNVAPPVTPPNEGADVTVSGTLTLQADAFIENITVEAVGINSKDELGTAYNIVSDVNVDDISDESSRLVAGIGQYPASGYGTAYNSSSSLKSVLIDELQLKNGLYQVPSGNYLNTKPVSGDNYDENMGSNERYCIPLAPFTLTNASGFTIEILDADGFAEEITPDLYLHLKVEGQTGWINANTPFNFVGSPSNNGDACMVISSSTATEKRISFGDTLRTGLCYIRIGLPAGDAKKFSGILIKNIV